MSETGAVKATNAEEDHDAPINKKPPKAILTEFTMEPHKDLAAPKFQAKSKRPYPLVTSVPFTDFLQLQRHRMLLS